MLSSAADEQDIKQAKIPFILKTNCEMKSKLKCPWVQVCNWAGGRYWSNYQSHTLNAEKKALGFPARMHLNNKPLHFQNDSWISECWTSLKVTASKIMGFSASCLKILQLQQSYCNKIKYSYIKVVPMI